MDDVEVHASLLADEEVVDIIREVHELVAFSGWTDDADEGGTR